MASEERAIRLAAIKLMLFSVSLAALGAVHSVMEHSDR
jgi:hypothetical protein